MKTMTYLKLVLLTVLAINLTSCEVSIDDFYDDDNINNSYIAVPLKSKIVL